MNILLSWYTWRAPPTYPFMDGLAVQISGTLCSWPSTCSSSRGCLYSQGSLARDPAFSRQPVPDVWERRVATSSQRDILMGNIFPQLTVRWPEALRGLDPSFTSSSAQYRFLYFSLADIHLVPFMGWMVFPQNLYTEVLTSSMSECDLIRHSHCWCNRVRWGHTEVRWALILDGWWTWKGETWTWTATQGECYIRMKAEIGVML